MFNDETPKESYFETIHDPFEFNPFSLNFTSQAIASLALFAQPVKDFYLDDSMALTSITIADCSLYISKETNFISEI